MRLGFRVFVWVQNIHPFNEAVLNGVDVMDNLIGENVSRKVTNDLMDADHGSAVGVLFNTHRFNARIEKLPLAFPVSTNVVATEDPATLHSIGPVHVRVHQGKNRLDFPSVECIISDGEKFSI